MKTSMAALKKKKIKKRAGVKKVDSLTLSVRLHGGKTVKKTSGKVKIFDLRKPLKKSAKKVLVLELKRAKQNPIIEPARNSYWESKATLNPTALYHNDKVHIIYRAIGDNDSSVLGYAGSYDGYNIAERLPYPVYKRPSHSVKPDISLAPIDYISGGGWNGGCEDPRLTLLGDTVYMLYTAFDGWGSVRIALTSIPLADFEKKNWIWKAPVLISPRGEVHKNWVLFPEKINGKFAILHSFFPTVRIDYFESLNELDGTKFIHSDNTRPIDSSRDWDSWFRGVGPAPIKTDIGWLILYHAMDHKNPDRYRLGALILDLKDPTKVLYRSSAPILEPEEYYENNGYKWGVVYSCGAVVVDGTLFVYYGGADKVIGVASVPLNRLLEDLKTHRMTKLKKQAVQL
ncbi:MAG: hypothetical protein AAB933_00945 [Patescibacteria group bacterium]